MTARDTTDEGSDRVKREDSTSIRPEPDTQGLKTLDGNRKENLARLKAGGRSGITDEFGKPVLIASDDGVGQTMLDGRITNGRRADFEFIDSNGVPPFGERLSAEASRSNVESDSYYSTTLGLIGTRYGAQVNQEVINVNISDKMPVNDKQIYDGQPHRQVFPLTNGPTGDLHWHWIDATVRYDRMHDMIQLKIHRLSPSLDKPKSEDEWDQLNQVYTLKHSREPQHAPADQYFLRYEPRHRRESETPGAWRTNFYEAVRIPETAQEK